ncbi:class I SAM-dependent methyltransferase [Corynebacterium kozikiae]|uniref:class I SAM-dependent methyltransferase n=1 Tax=Corynebacterium kozikiae TaxID=2968469 RepID=UPI00211D08B9|nr:class I SAM-dependent methyltransferase [Corynebacterium sp. 76QC2CO]MCQ9342899.1 class I SAM-dependent methyltransferase [Corynebacterium sp. 76QC2CO]
MAAARGFIDPEFWPHVAAVPDSVRARMRARKAEAEFAQACEKAQLVLEGPEADLKVMEADLFLRIAQDGWLGLAEGFMAGDWSAESISDVLTRLVEAGYSPKSGPRHIYGPYDGTEIPPELVRHFSGDGMSAHGTIFASGVPTRERVSVKSFTASAGRNGEPASHFVDVTTYSSPAFVERADLKDAQMRAVSNLLDQAKITSGTHVLDFPSAGATLPIAASRRRATIDAITSSVEQAQAMRQMLALAQVDGSVHVEVFEEPLPKHTHARSMYDAVVSVEKLDKLGARGRKHYVKSINAQLSLGGNVGLQTVIASDPAGSAKARDALAVCNAYLWPAFEIVTAEQVHQLFDTHSNIRLTAQTHFGNHYAVGLRLQRETFEGKLREAAAEGFDAVYRRLWIFQLAMHEALFRAGILDAVQFSGTTRVRRAARRR